jgi:hypothetical protein
MPPIRIASFVVGFVVAVLPGLFGPPAAKPDEGQWLPGQIRDMDWEALQKRGLRLTKDEFWHPTEGGVLTAAVQISGCSASFCSPEGLVVTNHHCGFGAVQQLSTVQKNYVRDGYVAADAASELPAPGMSVQIVRRIENVTERIQAAAAKAKSDAERVDLIEAEVKAIVAAGEKEPDTVCSVASFLNGTEYHLYYRTKLDDVRLVYAPPRMIGEYGGEDDNWEWPRHTGDFMFFRAYVSPDGKPARYAKENVPYRPKHFLKTAREGVNEGDLVMVLGYPGRTNRYLTSEGVKGFEAMYPVRYSLFTETIRLLELAGKESEERALALSSTIKSLANVQKNALGMTKGLARNGVAERKLREEKEFAAWLAADPARAARHGDVLPAMLAFEKEQAAFQRREAVLGTLLGQTAPLLGALVNHADQTRRAAEAGPESRPRTAAGAARGLSSAAVARDFATVQLPLIAFAAEEARKLPADERPAGLEAFVAGAKPGLAGALEWFGRTKFADAAYRKEVSGMDAAALAKLDDPLAPLARALVDERSASQARAKAAAGRRLDLGRRWIAAQQEWRGKSFYPDANSTLRVSLASVKGYSPEDGAVNLPRTTVKGLLEKHTGVDPFDAPAALREAARDRAKSRFFDAKLGDVPVCFLSDADTTGGNSGSCVVNGKGELVGLNFDRVFENVAGDFGWSPERSRNVICDIRYVLWCVESVMPSPRLLRELGF